MKKKYISFFSGFIRFERLEINWHLNNWALPLSIDINKYLIFLQILFISFIFKGFSINDKRINPEQ